MSPTHTNGVESNEESRYIDEKEYESQEMDYMQVNKFKITIMQQQHNLKYNIESRGGHIRL